MSILINKQVLKNALSSWWGSTDPNCSNLLSSTKNRTDSTLHPNNNQDSKSKEKSALQHEPELFTFEASFYELNDIFKAEKRGGSNSSNTGLVASSFTLNGSLSTLETFSSLAKKKNASPNTKNISGISNQNPSQAINLKESQNSSGSTSALDKKLNTNDKIDSSTMTPTDHTLSLATSITTGMNIMVKNEPRKSQIKQKNKSTPVSTSMPNLDRATSSKSIKGSIALTQRASGYSSYGSSATLHEETGSAALNNSSVIQRCSSGSNHHAQHTASLIHNPTNSVSTTINNITPHKKQLPSSASSSRSLGNYQSSTSLLKIDKISSLLDSTISTGNISNGVSFGDTLLVTPVLKSKSSSSLQSSSSSSSSSNKSSSVSSLHTKTTLHGQKFLSLRRQKAKIAHVHSSSIHPKKSHPHQHHSFGHVSQYNSALEHSNFVPSTSLPSSTPSSSCTLTSLIKSTGSFKFDDTSVPSMSNASNVSSATNAATYSGLTKGVPSVRKSSASSITNSSLTRPQNRVHLLPSVISVQQLTLTSDSSKFLFPPIFHSNDRTNTTTTTSI